MFRINIYAEKEERIRAARRRMVQLGVFAAAMGLNGLLVAFLVVSGRLLDDRARTIAREVERINLQADKVAVAPAQVALARELFSLRRDRIEWAPLLAAISETIPPELVVEELRGQVALRRARAGLEILGQVPDRGADVREVSQFVDALRSDVRVAEAFPDVNLGSMNSGTGGFQVTCGPAAN
ncbi:MAG TPA: hypothetical protein PLQ13_09785 [Candidatus Krumholzibacteria bacterium]|nr:hypothetical protein [Candidatus Krumholzibacteria bacterium]